MNQAHCELLERLDAFSLDEPDAPYAFSRRLAKENGWSRFFALRAIDEYKRFVFLAMTAGHPVTPSDAVDQVWHLHLTYTRSYWDAFCPKVLGRSLHHMPTRGGEAEQAKFVEQYRRTLDSYARTFGEAPPPDLWPAPEIRFGRDLHYARVNVHRRKLLSGRAGSGWNVSSARGMGMFCLTLLLAGSLASCEGANLNPMQLNGPEFLGFYAGAGFVLLLAARILRWAMNGPGPGGRVQIPPLSLEELAYLAGGAERAVDVALLGLFQRRHVVLDADGRTLRLLAPLPSSASNTERALVRAVAADGRLAKVRKAAKIGPLAARERLRQLRLTALPGRSRTAQLYSFALFLPLLLLGGLRIRHGLEIGKPVEFLVMLTILAALTALGFAFSPLHRSRYGERVYKELQGLPKRKTTPEGLLEAMALAGASVLVGTAFAAEGQALRRAGGGGGDSGGDGGDGGSGGCGGCGGGGD